MSTLWLTLLLMLAAASLWVVIAGWRSGKSPSQQRDKLNTEYYHQRLDELEQEEAEGVVSAKQEMVAELQQALLNDVPANRTPGLQRTSGRWVLLPALLILILVSGGFYLKTGGLMQVFQWQQVRADYPELRARLMDPQAGKLTLGELQQFSLGLRDSLQQHPDNLRDWAMLGRLGMVLNDSEIAKPAFERALRLAPTNQELKTDYAEVLVRSPLLQDQRQAQLILEQMRRQNPHDARLMALLAADYSAQQLHAQAITLWQQLLTRLAVNSPQADQIKKLIAQARSDSGQLIKQLNLTINLSVKAQSALTQQGLLYISVTDGVSSLPVAVKRLPLSHFPLSTSLDDSNAMLTSRLLSAQNHLIVRVRISRDGSTTAQSGDWYGEARLENFINNSKVELTIDRQQR